jgi:hypothetical protein
LPNSISLRRQSRVESFVNRITEAPRFHARAIYCLSARRHYAEATDLLRRIVEPHQSTMLPGVIATASGDLLLWRLACHFGAIPQAIRDGRALAPIKSDDFRRNKSEAARLALSCAGEIEWSCASRRVRAAFALGQLVRALKRRGAVP